MNFTWYGFVFSLTIGLCFTTTILANDVQQSCVGDRDCVKRGHKFCHEFECISCVPCAVLNRQKPPANRCAGNFEECGPCLPGYQPEEIKGIERFLTLTYHKCVKGEAPFRADIMFVTIILLAAAIALVIFFAVWRDRSRLKSNFKQVLVDTNNASIAGVHDIEGKPILPFLSSGISDSNVMPIEQDISILTIPVESHQVSNTENNVTLNEVVVSPAIPAFR